MTLKSFTDMKKGYGLLNAGAWVPDIPMSLFEGVRLQVRRIGNPDYLALQEKLLAEKSDLSAGDNQRRITDECLIQTCLTNWDGVDDPFSVETARQLLADPDMGGVFRSAIHWAIGSLTEQVNAQIEADAKN